MRFEPKREFSVFLCSNIDFWQHQTLLSKLTTLDLVASTSPFSSQTDPKFVSVLWRPIAMSFKPSSNQQRHTLHSSNFRWCCTSSLSGLTFFASVKASGFGQYGLFALRAQGYWASPTIFFHLPFVAVILTFEFLLCLGCSSALGDTCKSRFQPWVTKQLWPEVGTGLGLYHVTQ